MKPALLRVAGRDWAKSVGSLGGDTTGKRRKENATEQTTHTDTAPVHSAGATVNMTREERREGKRRA